MIKEYRFFIHADHGKFIEQAYSDDLREEHNRAMLRKAEKFGLLLGALEGIKHSVDDAMAKRIDEILAKARE